MQPISIEIHVLYFHIIIRMIFHYITKLQIITSIIVKSKLQIYHSAHESILRTFQHI